MQVHKVTLMIVDHDQLGPDSVKQELENAHFGNDCISLEIASIETKDIVWTDEHPLNKLDQWQMAFAELFPSFNE